MNLKDARAQIDQIDSQLIQLLIKRFDICSEIAKIKAEQNLPVVHPAREDEVAAQAANAGQPYGEEISGLFREIMKTSVILQKKLLTQLDKQS